MFSNERSILFFNPGCRPRWLVRDLVRAFELGTRLLDRLLQPHPRFAQRQGRSFRRNPRPRTSSRCLSATFYDKRLLICFVTMVFYTSCLSANKFFQPFSKSVFIVRIELQESMSKHDL